MIKSNYLDIVQKEQYCRGEGNLSKEMRPAAAANVIIIQMTSETIRKAQSHEQYSQCRP